MLSPAPLNTSRQIAIVIAISLGLLAVQRLFLSLLIYPLWPSARPAAGSVLSPRDVPAAVEPY